jgi:hypothetical protein
MLLMLSVMLFYYFTYTTWFIYHTTTIFMLRGYDVRGWYNTMNMIAIFTTMARAVQHQRYGMHSTFW